MQLHKLVENGGAKSDPAPRGSPYPRNPRERLREAKLTEGVKDPDGDGTARTGSDHCEGRGFSTEDGRIHNIVEVIP